MAEPIKIEENQSKLWAQEVTLQALARNLGTQNQSLQRLITKITGVKDAELENLEKLDDGLGDAAHGAQQVGKKLTQTADDIARAKEDLKYALQGSARKWTENIDRMGEGLRSGSSASAQFGRGLQTFVENIGKGLAGTGRVGAGLAVALGATATATSMAIERIIQTRDAFGTMVQSGLLFNRNILEFGADVRSTGLTIEQFGQIAEQHSMSMLQMGEQRFLGSIKNLDRTFGELGLNIQQGTQYFAEYLDVSRATGTAYLRTQEEQEAAFGTNIMQQTALARLTGVTVRQQQQERKALAERQSMRLLAAQLEGPQKDIYEKFLDPLGRLFGPDGAAGLLLQQFGKGSTAAGGAAQNMAGAAGMDIIQRAMSTGDVGMLQASIPQIAQHMRSVGRTLAITESPSAQLGMLYEMAIRGENLRTADDRVRQDEAGDIRTGRRAPLDAPSRAVMNSTREFAQAIGNLDSAFMRMSGAMLEQLTPALNAVADRLSAVDGGRMISGARSTIENLPMALGLDTILSGLGGIAAVGAAVGAKRLFGRGGTNAPPPPGTSPGPGRLAGGLRVGAPMALGLAAAEGFTTGDWGRALSVAAGSILGGVAGAAIGAPGGPLALASGVAGSTAGGLMGANLYDWFMGPGSTPTPTPPSALAPEPGGMATEPFRESITRMDTSMASVASYLAPGGHIHTTLQQVVNAVQSQGSRTVTAIANQ